MNISSDDASKELAESTVTFHFIDVEGSTELLRKLGDRYFTVLADHHRNLRTTSKKWYDRELDAEGDTFFVYFR